MSIQIQSSFDGHVIDFIAKHQVRNTNMNSPYLSFHQPDKFTAAAAFLFAKQFTRWQWSGEKMFNTDTYFISFRTVEDKLWFTDTMEKFVIVKNYGEGERILLIKDYYYWNDNEAEILNWLETCTPGASVAGIVITFNKEEERNWFVLRWS